MGDLAIMNDLTLKYQGLVGKVFQGTYRGVFEEMPQTGNPRDIFVIPKGNPLASILQGISQAVAQTYGNQIWKGITGPEDNYADYWLWVEPGLSQVLPVGSSCNFKIEQCAPFKGTTGTLFTYGVSIKVSVVP